MPANERLFPPAVSVPRIPRRRRDAALRQIRALLCAAWAEIGVWRGRRRQRLALARLDDRLLRDIGLTREQVEREIVKFFWQL